MHHKYSNPLWSKASYQTGTYSVRHMKLGDMNSVRKWRNDQIAVLRQTHRLTVLHQIIYYFFHIKKERNRHLPKQILFSVEKEGNLIAYGGLVHIEWRTLSAEFSFLHSGGEESSNYRESLRIFIDILRSELCPLLNISTLTTETYLTRSHHISLLEENGFVRHRNEFLLTNSKSTFHIMEIF